MSTTDDLDSEAQLEPPQQTVRAEAPDTGTREGRELTHGEVRIPIQAITAMEHQQLDRSAEISSRIARLKAAATACAAWLMKRGLTETGTWISDQAAYKRHHEAAVDEKNGDDAALARRPRIAQWMYVSLFAVLVVADFWFFFALWSDVEDSPRFLSAESFQAFIYALITPVVQFTVALAFGRVVAAWLHSGKGMSHKDRRLLIVVGGIALVSVLAVVFGVMQRMTVLHAADGGVSLNPVLFYSLFLLLPLGLGIAEALRHDHDVAIDDYRRTAKDAAAAHVDETVDTGTALYEEWVGAYESVTELRDETRLQLQEPLRAAADLISQERAHHGHDGSYAKVLWSSHEGPYVGEKWVDIELPTGAVDQVIDGPIPRVNLDRVNRLDAAMTEHKPPTAREWMAEVKKVLVCGGNTTAHDVVADDTKEADAEDVVDEAWGRELDEKMDDALAENDLKSSDR
ncbi:hypothetical protein [Gordonia aquimaris]|uniref:Uncharacterized protein n=1 Tax=Gordonia aquimaris TaxID=2984863 RepID=A0A9X3D8N0_9ACTN|nr:hypothetical protein [Gordonia aquimaris]MCX2966850.1 hypothetical protein [Gordonia aquimaris]